MGFLLPSRSIIVLVLFHVVLAHSVSTLQSYFCHEEARSALLQFKQSLTIDTSSSLHPKVSSWDGENKNCCSWDGIKCDDKTGNVIGLDVSSTGLYGAINSTSSLFRLVHLQSLNLAYNDFNHSQILSGIINFPRLRYLNLSSSVFSGEIPSEISHLSDLSFLSLQDNEFHGTIPASFANLTQLEYLSFAFNDRFSFNSLSWVGKQTKLIELDLEGIHLSGRIPSSLANLTHLNYINLRDNELTGPIPSWLGNLPGLVQLDLEKNKLSGSIPDSLFNLTHLGELSLRSNSLTGVVDIFKLQRVTKILKLGSNQLELLTESKTKNATALPQFGYLGLRSCNIKEFPDFLRYQQNLEILDLSANKLHGEVPKWMWNTSTQSLKFLHVGANFLSSFGQPTVVLPWVNLQVFTADFNLLQGSLPIPPQSILVYSVDDNKLTGEISHVFCNRSSLEFLSLPNNKLGGNIPRCLGNFSSDLLILNLGNNSFHGILPQTYSKTLEMIDISYNQLQGQLPMSLGNCTMLESLVLSNNEFRDNIPIWLGMLPNLKLLAMSHNQFYGVIESTKKHIYFPQLCVLDLSYNNLMGEFPFEDMFSGNVMKGATVHQPTYMHTNGSDKRVSYIYTTTLSNKGVQRYYEGIREDLGLIDISSNKFQGNIPEFVGKLKGLRFLNISHNKFTGSIPSLMGNLTLLEALDLSQNHLSGEIPQQLAQLTSLAVFNVSYNNITGSIPKGTQFQTYESTSFEGNPGLCGDQLLKKCSKSNAPSDLPSAGMEEIDLGFGIEFDWKFILAGTLSGLPIGMVLADVAIKRRHGLFLEIVGMLIRTMIRFKRNIE